MSQPVEMVIKFVFAGEGEIGKTSIIQRFVNDTFDPDSKSTPNTANYTRDMSVDDQRVKFDIIDTAGQEFYHSVIPMLLREANCVVLCFDPQALAGQIKSPRESLKYWSQFVEDGALQSSLRLLVATKLDLWKGAVPDILKDTEDLKTSCHADHYFQVSAKEGAEGVEEMFIWAAQKCVKRRLYTAVAIGGDPPPPAPACSC
jgi:small GTP-binding protein